MNKRERLEKTIMGDATDCIPVSVWRPFPGDDQRAADFAKCVIDFQRLYDWDFVNLYPASNYMVVDYGFQDEWQGAPDGQRVSLKSPIKRSLDWTELRPIDPQRGEYGKTLECLRHVVEVMRAEETPVIVTVYSPLTQAAQLVGSDQFLLYLRKNTDRLCTGLNILTESTLRYLEALRGMGVDGIYYVIDHADYHLFSESEYDLMGLPYDRKILDTLPAAWWLNVVHLRGVAPMFRFTSSYVVQCLNWQNQQQNVADVRPLFGGAICGGLDVENHLLRGTPATIRDVARTAINQMSQRRLMLTAGGAALTTTPYSNLRAVREGIRV